MQDEGRGTRTNNIRRRLTVSNVCMQAKPSVGKRKNITDDSSQFDEEDIGSKGSGAYDSGIVLWVMYQMPLADKKHFNYLSHKFGFVVFL